MNVENVNNTHFGARIVISKKCFKQLSPNMDISKNAGLGTSSLLTGLSSYIGSVVTGIDTLIYHSDLPKSAVNYAQSSDFINVIHKGMGKCNQEPIDRTFASSILSITGFVTQIKGLKFIKKANKVIKTNDRKLPS